MVLLLLIVYFLAVSTPWLAKKIDKILKKPERVADDNKKGAYDFKKDDIASPFGAQINNENNNGDDLYNGLKVRRVICNATSLEILRITSYNVCYTKLLRLCEILLHRSNRINHFFVIILCHYISHLRYYFQYLRNNFV